MASVIPSVMVAVVLIASMLVILGGVVYYYGSIYKEPAILPAYGTVYVKSVDPTNYEAEIVNRFGHPVKTLFSVYVSSMTLPQYGSVSSGRYVSFWVTLRPGINRVNLLSEAQEALGASESTSLTIDLSKSYFVIGNVKYPITVGAGVPKPVSMSGSAGTQSFKASGIGVKTLSGNSRYVSMYFDSDTMTISHTVKSQMGYRRSISSYKEVTVTTRYDYGYRCGSYTNTVSGKVQKEGSYTDWWCYYSCFYPCYYSCYNSTDFWDCYWDCHYSCLDKCTTTYYYCGSATCSHTTAYKYYYTKTYTAKFACASDGISSIYKISEMTVSHSTQFKTLALRGLSYFTISSLGRDTLEKTSGGTSYQTGDWPYTLPQSACDYRYREIYWKASLTSYTWYACDYDCGVKTYYYECSEWSTTVRDEIRNACSPLGKKCASLDRYLYGRIEYTIMNVTSDLTSGDSITLRFNITYVLDYNMVKDDPESAENYIRVWITDTVTITLPKVTGYIGISYLDTVKDVKVSINPSISVFAASVKTASGYTSTAYLNRQATGGTYSTTITPIGYVAISSPNVESAKTYKYVTTQNPTVTVTISTPSNGILVPRKSSDTIIVTVIFVLTITPEVDVTVEVAQG
jgi:hypothetical protein